MKFIVGLGNPGFEYRSTKHNVGLNVARLIAKECGIKINKKLYSSLMGRGRVAGEDVVIVLPQTYMNLSGKAVGELFEKEIKDIADLLVICDDVNLKLGRIRLRRKGSAGGHKGLTSIINILKRDDFPRLRVGIATDIHKGDITNYVLSPFKRKELKNVSHALALAKDTAIAMIKDGMDKAVAKFNQMKVGTS